MSIKNGHIRWAFKLTTWKPTLDELLIATACIQPEEKQRLAAFMFRDDFQASLIGRLLMRKFVCDATDIPYENIVFNRDERGKPFLAMGVINNLAFNVSHQGNYTVIAGTVSSNCKSSQLNQRIGVDIMKIEYTGGKRLDEFFRIMDRNFASNEWNNINRQSTDQLKLQAFMRHWCLKESFVKMIGLGITIPLEKISFSIHSDYAQPYVPNLVINDTTLRLLQSFDTIQDPSKLTFEESKLDDEHCVAVVLCDHNQHSYEPIPFEIVNFGELTNGCQRLLNEDIEYCKSILNKPYKTQ